MKKRTIGSLVWMVVVALSWVGMDALFLPAWNLQDFGFWVFGAVFIGLELGLVIRLLDFKNWAVVGSVLCGAILLGGFVLSIGSWLIFPGNDQRYFARLSVEQRPLSAWAKDFPGASVPGSGAPADGQSLILPATDKEISTKIAQSKLGNYGAQFQMDPEIFTAMAIRDAKGLSLVRVTPLDYSGVMVALNGGGKGTAGYIAVDQVSEQSKLVEVPGGLRYTPGAVLGYDLYRHVRSAYKSALLEGWSFELDDQGKPYWVIPEVVNTIGLFGGATCVALILVDPVTGELQRFARGSQPAWLDRALPTSLVKEMADDALSLRDGWSNKLMGEKKGVSQLSDSYNYVVSDDGGEGQTWFVAGNTSPNEADQTMTGMMMVNLRTGQARAYALSGITEMRAQEIAENDERVRAQKLAATWPILVDVDGQAAYYLFLKNSVQRQRFVFVDAATGQKVAMGDTLAAARSQYVGLMGVSADSAKPLETIAGVVLRTRDIGGDTTIFLLAGEPKVSYQLNSRTSNGARFLAAGDKVELGFQSSPANPGERFVQVLRNLTIGE